MRESENPDRSLPGFFYVYHQRFFKFCIDCGNIVDKSEKLFYNLLNIFCNMIYNMKGICV